MDEFIDILNINGEVSGETCLKSEAHKKGLFHASVHVWIYDLDKNVLVQLRSKDKDVFPNLWDVSVAGHISAGEKPLDSAIREVQEEIGLELHENQLQFIGTWKKKVLHSDTLIDNELHYIYTCEIAFDISTLNIQKEEVTSIKTISINELITEVHLEKNIFVPHGSAYYNFVLNTIQQ